MKRAIKLKTSMLRSAAVQTAFAQDRVNAANVTQHCGDVSEYFDEEADDFPVLRSTLEALNASYDWYSQKSGSGDHTLWRQFRRGGYHTATNFGDLITEGVPKPKPLDQCVA
jgi:hypothetical protein